MPWRCDVTVDGRKATSVLVFVVLAMTSSSPVSCLGEFQLVLRSFQNSQGLSANASCCNGTGSVPAPVVGMFPTCRQPCRTFFRVCFSHYQANIPMEPQCTYGLKTTDVLGYDSFSLSSSNEASGYTITFDFNFTWTGSFTLVIEAFHDMTGGQPYEGSPRKLITRIAIQRLLAVGVNWTRESSMADALTRSSLVFDYRAVCLKTYYGPGCVDVCAPRDDLFGHYECDAGGRKVCNSGWNGSYCESPVCLEGCNTTFGSCSYPFECRCRYGWEGELCDKCMKYPNCSQGGCNLPWQCNCNDGWGGPLCNVDLNFCSHYSPCLKGGTCWNNPMTNYTCRCLPGFEGKNCEIAFAVACSLSPCRNGGTCQESNGNSTCLCPKGFTGSRCELSGDVRFSRDFTLAFQTDDRKPRPYDTADIGAAFTTDPDNTSMATAKPQQQPQQLTWKEVILIACLGGSLPVALVALSCVVCVFLKRRRAARQGGGVNRSNSCTISANVSQSARPAASTLDHTVEKLNNSVNKNLADEVLAAKERNRFETTSVRQTRKIPNVNLNGNASSADVYGNVQRKWTGSRQPETSSRRPETHGNQYFRSSFHRPDRFPDILDVTDFIRKNPLAPKEFHDSPRGQGTPSSVEYDFVSVVARWRYNNPPDVLSTDV